MVHLLNKLNYLNEWAQCAVLNLVARFRPPQKEILDYLNLLEPRMNHSNGAIVFATVKVFLALTQDYVSLYAKVLSRVRTPLLTVISTGSDEMKVRGFFCFVFLSCSFHPFILSDPSNNSTRL